MTFSDFDTIADDISIRGGASIAKSFTAAQWHALPAKALPCGYFILTLTDGSTREFRIRLEKMGALAGQRTLSLLTGPTRESEEWDKVAVVREEGFEMQPRYRKERVAGWAVVLWRLLHDDEYINGYVVQCDIRCRWTMHKLTDDAARERQLNLTAAKRFGLVEVKKRNTREGGKK